MTPASTLTRPATLATVRLVAWGNAALHGRTSLDEAASVSADDRAHRVRGLDGEAAPVNLAYAFGRLRALGATRLRAVLPVPGDLAGLTGPADFNQAALAAGAAVLVMAARPLGLVPDVGSDSVEWTAAPVPGAGEATSSVMEAQRALTAALAETTEELTRLDVTTWQPQPAVHPAHLQHPWDRAVPLPPGHRPQAVRLAVQAVRLLQVAERALADDGGAASGSEVRLRTGALTRLHTAARRALAAAATDG